MEPKARGVAIGENEGFGFRDPSDIETKLGADGYECQWMTLWAHSAFGVSVE